MKHLALSIAIIGIIFSSVSSLTAKFESRAELSEVKKAYFEENMKPYFDEWKSRIDESLNDEELQKLNELRQETAEITGELQSKMQAIYSEFAENDERPAKREMIKKIFPVKQDYEDAMLFILLDLKPLAESISNTLDDIAEEARPLAEKWHKEMIEIFREKISNDGKGHCKRNKHRRLCQNEEFAGKMFMAKVMLYNSESEEYSINKESHYYAESLSLFNAPNPFENLTKIEFYLPEPQQVKLFVADSEGNEIDLIFEGELQEGNHTFDYNPKGIASGMYIYTVQGESFMKSEKMMISK